MEGSCDLHRLLAHRRRMQMEDSVHLRLADSIKMHVVPVVHQQPAEL